MKKTSKITRKIFMFAVRHHFLFLLRILILFNVDINMSDCFAIQHAILTRNYKMQKIEQS